MSKILVVGSAHLDILARSSHRDDVVDRIGTLSIEVGGTACNIAVNIAKIGVPTRFMTMLNESAFSKIIETYLQEQGVETIIQYEKDLPASGFSAHIDTDGELVSAVSSMPVEQRAFNDVMIKDAFDGVKAVCLDCNLSVDTIRSLALKARTLNIPAYVAAVSEEKSVRWAGVSELFKCAFMNKREARFMSQQVLGKRLAPLEMASLLRTTLLITDAEDGSVMVDPIGNSTKVVAPVIKKSKLNTRLGMGDAMAAGVIAMHEIHGVPLMEAGNSARKMAGWIGETENCHRGDHNAIEAAIRDIRIQATHDKMTGALNRASAETLLAKMLSERRGHGQQYASILLIDIDHFKKINDQFGHNTGDQVIRDVADKIRICLREEDSVCRWGGEEFVVTLPQTAIKEAFTVGERIRKAMELISAPRPITVSIGCVQVDHDRHKSMKPLIEDADKALYTAKHMGRNRVICSTTKGEHESNRNA